MTILSPQETPLLSSLPKGVKPTAAYHEWPVDILDDVNTDTVPEGKDRTSFENPGKDRARIGNYCNKQERAWNVSDLQKLVDQAGVPNEVATAKVKKLKELKRDMASRVGGDFDLSAAAPDYQARGLGVFIQSTAQSTHPVPALYRTPASSINTTAIGSLTEDDINSVLASVFEQGGNRANGNVYCGTAFKRAVSNFSRVTGSDHRTYQVTQSAESKKITLDVTTYEGDFGTVDLIPDLFLGHGPASTATIRRNRAYYIDRSLVSINFLEAPYHQELEDQGGGPRGFHKTWYTLVVKNPLGLAKWASTS